VVGEAPEQKKERESDSERECRGKSRSRVCMI
jgi:hypothetical protein